MPAYRGALDEEQIDELWRWVQALRAADRDDRSKEQPRNLPALMSEIPLSD